MKILTGAVVVVALCAGAWAASSFSNFWPRDAVPKIVTGPARVIDGDTIEIAGTRIRLEEIDAPETDQKCQDSAGRDYLCGIAASKVLRDLIGHELVTCERTRKAIKERRGRWATGWRMEKQAALHSSLDGRTRTSVNGCGRRPPCKPYSIGPS